MMDILWHILRTLRDINMVGIPWCIYDNFMVYIIGIPMCIYNEHLKEYQWMNANINPPLNSYYVHIY